MSATIICVMGVAGAGKSTVGQMLAAELGSAFLDGDSLHPPANIREGVFYRDRNLARHLGEKFDIGIGKGIFAQPREIQRTQNPAPADQRQGAA